MVKFYTFLLVLSLVGCADSTLLKPDAKPIAEKDIPKMLAVSLRHWESLKVKYGDNYKYERIQAITSEQSSSTHLQIENGQVEYRDYFEWHQGNTPSLIWSEPFADLNTHNQGMPVKTIDELYQQCKLQIINKPIEQYSVQLKLDAFNILQQCSYTQLSCSAKCTSGIRISGLTIPIRKSLNGLYD